MAINSFVRAWEIVSSDHSEYFPIGSTVLIGIANDEKTKCNVIWEDVKGQCWCITELSLGEDGALEVLMTIRSTQLSVPRRVTLRLDEDMHLQGTLTDRQYGIDGPVGTFTAKASIGEEVLAASRREERIAV